MRSARPSTWAALTVHAASASSGDSDSCVAASEQTSGQALAERAARVEVRRERDGRAGVDERARGRHRPVQEERARREEHSHDVARREHRDAGGPRRLEVIDGSRSELGRERDRAGLRELVAVQAKREAGVAAGDEVSARLARVEGATLEEHVRRLRDLGGLRKDVLDEEVDVRVPARVGELGRDRVRSEPGRDTARVAHHA